MASRRAVPNALLGHWVHSHEEDTATAMVFRPASFRFPPSRGRTGFELRGDHSLVEIALGAADVPTEATGRWELSEDQKELRWFRARATRPYRTFTVHSVDAKCLKLARPAG